MIGRQRLDVIGVTGLLAVAALVASCGSGSSDAERVADTNLAIDRERIESATMQVRSNECGPRAELGIATAIGDGIAVTAAHVVAGAAEVTLVDADRTATSAEVVLFDPDLDVAALRAIDHASDSMAPVQLRPERASEGETGVMAIVADDGTVELRDVEVLQRVTIETTDISGTRDVERPGLRLAATVDRGDSGAMVHLAGGGVGIVWSRSTATPDQAWTVDLPRELIDPAERRTLTTPVDTGDCG